VVPLLNTTEYHGRKIIVLQAPERLDAGSSGGGSGSLPETRHAWIEVTAETLENTRNSRKQIFCEGYVGKTTVDGGLD